MWFVFKGKVVLFFYLNGGNKVVLRFEIDLERIGVDRKGDLCCCVCWC